MGWVVELNKQGCLIACKRISSALDKEQKEWLDTLQRWYSNFDPLVSVAGNFLDEVLIWTKEILNHVHKEGPIYDTLKNLFEWCKEKSWLDVKQ